MMVPRWYSDLGVMPVIMRAGNTVILEHERFGRFPMRLDGAGLPVAEDLALLQAQLTTLYNAASDDRDTDRDED